MFTVDGVQYQEQGAVPAPPKGSFVYRVDGGRKITHAGTVKIADLALRKGGTFSPFYRHKDGTFWLTPEPELPMMLGVVIRETGIKEAYVGFAELRRIEKKDAKSSEGQTLATAPQAQQS